MKNNFLILLTMLAMTSCMNDWLSIRPDQKMVVIKSPGDIRALLDNADILNAGNPLLGEASSDNFALSQASWAALSSFEHKNAAIWATDIFQENSSLCWENSFQKIFYCNLALERIQELPENEKTSTEGKNLKGTALFFRAWAYFHVAQVFCDQYSGNASSVLGLPLRLESDMEIPSKRSSLQETYELIISDLQEAVELLEEVSVVKSRPGKAAAYGLQAKVYLQSGQYDNALKAAEKLLSIHSTLLNFQSLDSIKAYPFDRFNEEVIFHSTLRSSGIFTTSNLSVASELLQSYAEGDLRKTLFFVKRPAGFMGFRGSYNGNNTFFNGISVNEMILIAAECHARLGNLTKSKEYMNGLLVKRFKASQFIPVNMEGKEQALALILQERNKELVFRGIRWHDLKRLKEEYSITLVRNIGAEKYSLPPGDKKWTLPFPPNVIRLSGMQQNER